MDNRPPTEKQQLKPRFKCGYSSLCAGTAAKRGDVGTPTTYDVSTGVRQRSGPTLSARAPTRTLIVTTGRDVAHGLQACCRRGEGGGEDGTLRDENVQSSGDAFVFAFLNDSTPLS